MEHTRDIRASSLRYSVVSWPDAAKLLQGVLPVLSPELGIRLTNYFPTNIEYMKMKDNFIGLDLAR